MARHKDVQRSFRLSADLDTKLIKRAEEIDRSASWVINRLLEVELLGKNQAMGTAAMRSASKVRKAK